MAAHPPKDPRHGAGATTERPPPDMGRPSRRTGWGVRILSAVGLVLTFILALVIGILLHLGTAPSRRTVVSIANSLLRSMFVGVVRIDRIGSLSPDQVSEIDITVLDEAGREVLVARGLGADVALLKLLRSLLLGKGPLEIVVQEVRLANAQVHAIQRSDGTWSIARALQPPQPQKPSEPSAPGRGVDVRVVAASLSSVAATIETPDGLERHASIDTVAASGRYSPERIEADLQKLQVGLEDVLPEPIRVSAEGAASIPSQDAQGRKASISLRVNAGAVPLRVDASLEGDRVALNADTPEVSPAELRTIVPSSPLRAPVQVHLEGGGTLPELGAQLKVNLGEGTVRAWATANLGKEISGKLGIALRNVDGRALGAGRSDLDADGSASFSVAGGAISSRYVFETRPTEYNTTPIPALRTSGRFLGNALQGRATIDEPGAPTAIEYRLYPAEHPEDGRVAAFELSSRARDLKALKRLGGTVTGWAAIEAKGSYALKSGAIQASVVAQGGGVRRGDLHLQGARVRAEVSGLASAPKVDASIAARDVGTGRWRYRTADVSAVGDKRDLRLGAVLEGEGVPRVAAGGVLHLDGALRMSDVRIGIRNLQERLEIVAPWVKVLPEGGVEAHRVRITGLGDEALITARAAKDAVSLDVIAPNLDLGKLERVTGMEGRIGAGRIGMLANLAVGPNRGTGTLWLDVMNGSFGEWKGADAHIEAKLDGRTFRGLVNVGMAGTHSSAQADLDLAGGPMSPRAWQSAKGSAVIESIVDLARIASSIPGDALPVSEAKGELQLKAELSRDTRNGLPDLRMEARTYGLQATGKVAAAPTPEGTLVAEELPWKLRNVDVHLRAGYDDSEHAASVRMHMVDKRGVLASVRADASLPLEELVSAGARMREKLNALPFTASLIIPRREIESLPIVGDRAGVRGTIEASVHAAGPLQEPRLGVVARVTGVRSLATVPGVPFDADASWGWAGKHGEGTVRMARSNGPEVLKLDAHTDADLGGIATGAGMDSQWKASANATIKEFPLEMIPQRTTQPVRGLVSGTVRLGDLHRNGHLQAELGVKELRIGSAEFPNGRVTARVEDGLLKAGARLEQTDGHVDVGLEGKARWGTALAPAVDEESPLQIGLDASRFRAVALLPLLRGSLNQLDGRIDGKASIRVDPGRKGGEMKGELVFSEGLVEAPALGEELRDVRARVSINPWGTLRVDDVSARGVSGRLTANAKAELEGFSLKNAEAHLRIDDDEALPVTLQGVSMGEAWGKIDATVKVDPSTSTTEGTVSIPSFHMSLPHKTGNQVQSLDGDPSVKVGVHTPDGKLVLLPLEKPKKKAEPETGGGQQSRLVVNAKLGDDVWITRDTSIRVQIKGAITADVAEEAKVTGAIQLVRGKAEVFGKKFEVEKGTITFSGDDPGNPTILATAYYDAPDGTRVFAEFVGPLKTGKVNLRSEPPLSRNEIVSVLLFGSPSGSLGATPPPGQEASGAARAAGLGGGVLTQGLNKMLSDVVPFDVTTKVDTSKAQNPRPEIAVQLTRDVAAELSYRFGLTTPGDNPDRTMLTLDVRVKSNWSVQGTVGDRGTSILDLLWRYRY